MKIKIEEIKKMCLAVLIKKGLSAQDAETVVDECLGNEISGRTCHGLNSFKGFVAKKIEPEGEAKIIKETESYLYIDGQKNLGQIVCKQYVPVLMEKARQNGIAMMGIYNMHSYLVPGTYAQMMAENNLVGFVFNYGGGPLVAPVGGIDAVLSTNPIAIGIPAKDAPVVMDIATSKIAMRKVRLAAKIGQKIPTDTALDKDGQLTTDPNLVTALLPLDGRDGHKGYALGLMMEILTRSMFKIEPNTTRGFLFFCFDPQVFIPLGEFGGEIKKLIKEVKNSRKAPGVKEIFLPGEQSARIRKENLKKGYLEVDENIIKEIKELL
ncbi:MAG: Ldh family oxidoreductase [Patescibacteria group bacterium]